MQSRIHYISLLSILLTLLTVGAMPSRADEKIRIMTFNVPKGNILPAEGLNTWENRAASICRFLSESRPDLLGMQETVVSQLTDILSGIKGYAMIGMGREDGAQGGEYSPIIYRTDRFLVERSGNYWLSLTPDRVSKDWNSWNNRIATWAVFRDKHTGARFLYTNTHLDHISAEARHNQMRVIKEQMQKILSTTGEIPALITGDLNSNGSTDPMLVDATTYLTPMSDAYIKAATRHGVSYTFPPTHAKGDYILISDGISVSDSWIYNSWYDNGQKLSDHNPHYADISWPLSTEERADSLARIAKASLDSLMIWSPKASLLSSVTPFSSDGMEKGSSYAYLTDATASSVYHSAYTDPLPPAFTHYIQADLQRTDVQAFTLSLSRPEAEGDAANSPEEIRIYASPDGTAWQYVADVFSIEYSRYGHYVSPCIVMPEGMRYLRLYVTRTAAMNIVTGGPRFAIGTLNFMQYTADTARSQRLYNPEMVRAAAALSAARDAAIASPSETSIQALALALQKVREIYIPIQLYDALLEEATEMKKVHTVGSKIGQTSAEAAAQYTAGLEKVKASVPERGSKAQYETAVGNLRSLMETFEGTFVTPEAGKWYYIVNQARIVVGTTRNRTLYADSLYSSAPLKAAVVDNDNTRLSGSASPYAMWRFVPSADGRTFALQNRGTGFYLGQPSGKVDSCYRGSREPTEFRLSYPASGILSFLSPAGGDLCMSASNDGRLYNGAGGAATSAAWAIQAVDSELDSIVIPVRQNSISIMCLPFAAEGISLRNAGMKAYTIAWIPQLIPTVYLKRKDSFAAGEPFVLLVGNPADENTAADSQVMLRLTPPDDFVTSGGKASGLVGILDRADVPPSMYFERNILRNHNSITRLEAQSGFIIRSQAPTNGTDYDLMLKIGTLVNAVRSPRISTGSEGAVYTPDGVRADLRMLPAGSIYIQNGRKTLKH